MESALLYREWLLLEELVNCEFVLESHRQVTGKFQIGDPIYFDDERLAMLKSLLEWIRQEKLTAKDLADAWNWGGVDLSPHKEDNNVPES